MKKKKFIVGWNGRATSYDERNIKGYDFYKKAVDILEFETLELIGKDRIPYTDLPKFYDQISVLVLPSNCEGCSNTINEALASGVPVLAFKTGWHGDIATEMADGIIWIERRVKDIMTKLQFLKDNPKVLKILAQNGLKFAERHSGKNLAPLYNDSFNEMIKHTKTLPVEEKIPICKPVNSQERIQVRALKKCNLGKIEKHGATLWFEKGMVRSVPYYGQCKEIIDQNIKSRFLVMIN